MKILFIFLLSLSLQTAFAQSQEEIDANEILETEVAAQAMSAEDMSCNKTSDCHILPLGSQACGGAQLYLVASIVNASYDDVVTLAKRSVTLEGAYNRKYGIYSTCSLISPPRVKCVAHQCKTLTR